MYSTSVDTLVVYCAHDSLYSEELLAKFEQDTGIDVTVRFDTESTKSLGLVNLLLRQKNNPQCDVFWNNEVLGTIDLQEAGMLEPYQGSGYKRIPPEYKDPKGHWTGFGGRLRVVIFNTDLLAPPPTSNIDTWANQLIDTETDSFSIAKPLFGTTRSHATLLWHEKGELQFEKWHRSLHASGVIEAQGNAMVKNLVASGKCKAGWTDTDDYFVAADKKRPVGIAPVRLGNGNTICIPNTVSIIKGTSHSEKARRLVDFLLSEETELSLARSQSRQIPLGTVVNDDLPKEVVPLRTWALESVDLKSIIAARRPCLSWLKAEYLQ